MRKAWCFIVIVTGLALLSGCGNADRKDTETGITERADNTEQTEISETDIMESMESDVPEDIPEEGANVNGVLFSTEYDVEDYCQGCFIVSKNDGLLYGMLDKSGNEILPVEYDNLEFMNDEQVKDDKVESLYIKTTYEDVYTVVNTAGQQILEDDVTCIDYELGEGDADSAFFQKKSTEDHWIKFYKENGEFLSELNCGDNVPWKIENVSKNCYLVSKTDVSIATHTDVTYTDTTLYDMQNQIIKQWDGMRYVDSIIENGRYIFYLFSNEGKVYQFGLDELGSLTEDREISWEDFQKENIVRLSESQKDKNKTERYLGKDKNIKLYYSNDTWKLVDENENPIYDERYYECLSEDGCYILVNENNEMCLIDRNGEKVVDYGWLTWDGSAGKFNGSTLTTDMFHAGDDGVCFTQGGDVYFFAGSE